MNEVEPSAAPRFNQRLLRRLLGSSPWHLMQQRVAPTVLTPRVRRLLRAVVDRTGWIWLQLRPRDELQARDRQSWASQSPTEGLTWGVQIKGDAFVEKAHQHGLRGTVLEIGPGYGRLPEAALRLSVPFERWIGLDISPQNVEHLERRFGDDGRFRFVLGDAEKVEIADKVDTIVSSLTLKHVFPTFQEVLRNVARTLEPGGTVIVDFIEGEHLRHFEPLRGNFIRSYSRKEIAEIFGRCGLSVEAFDYVDHSPDPEHRRLLAVGRSR